MVLTFNEEKLYQSSIHHTNDFSLSKKKMVIFDQQVIKREKRPCKLKITAFRQIRSKKRKKCC